MKRYLFVLLLLTIVTVPSRAFPRDHGSDRHFEPGWDDDWRYRRHDWWPDWDFMMSPPPIGVVIDALPHGYSVIMIGELTYYYYNDVYFRSCPDGYIIVEKPATVYKEPVVKKAETVPLVDSFVVNIPNTDGTYAPVKLTKKGEGYIGPQGEYYEGHPTVKQLKALYGK